MQFFFAPIYHIYKQFYPRLYIWFFLIIHSGMYEQKLDFIWISNHL